MKNLGVAKTHRAENEAAGKVDKAKVSEAHPRTTLVNRVRQSTSQILRMIILKIYLIPQSNRL